jgi:hypothetical protein
LALPLDRNAPYGKESVASKMALRVVGYVIDVVGGFQMIVGAAWLTCNDVLVVIVW